jgi:hypothetical protein
MGTNASVHGEMMRNEKAKQNSCGTPSLYQGGNGGHLRLATDITISVQPDGDSWKVAVMQEGSEDDADRRQMIEEIAARLKVEYDLSG